MIIDILLGKRNEKIKQNGFDELSVFGIMAKTDPKIIRAVLDFLIDKGFLVSEGGEYPVVVLGSGYQEVLNEKQRVIMKLPKITKKKKTSHGGTAARRIRRKKN